MPISATNSISALEEVAMYTEYGELSICEIMRRIAEKENNGPAPSHKSEGEVVREYFGEIVPDFDRERVYDSHIKKLFQWYNVLQAAGLVDAVNEEVAEENETEE